MFHYLIYAIFPLFALKGTRGLAFSKNCYIIILQQSKVKVNTIKPIFREFAQKTFSFFYTFNKVIVIFVDFLP